MNFIYTNPSTQKLVPDLYFADYFETPKSQKISVRKHRKYREGDMGIIMPVEENPRRCLMAKEPHLVIEEILHKLQTEMMRIPYFSYSQIHYNILDMKKVVTILLSLAIGQVSGLLIAQSVDVQVGDNMLRQSIEWHRDFLSIPNLPENEENMLDNIEWVSKKMRQLGFETKTLPTETLPILFAQRTYDDSSPTVLFYFHIDGQPVDPSKWDQENPFVPVLKRQDTTGLWQVISWTEMDKDIDDEWRIYARSASDDKAPIVMLLSALHIMEKMGQRPAFNIKLVFDPEEEYGSRAFLETMEKYKQQYAADYFLVMDGPAHESNRPTLTFGCRGIALCAITTYGPKLPQHSGHFGNYTPNPVFDLANLLSSMKDSQGRVQIKDYYKEIRIDEATGRILRDVPYDSAEFNQKLGIYTSDKVGRNYQEALQYPSLNVRQIGTSWTGQKQKTVVPAYATASIDVRLVPEIDGQVQLQRIKDHIEAQGYYVIDRDPTDEERSMHAKIVKYQPFRLVNAFRTNPNDAFGKKLRTKIANDMGEDPVVIRMMGGTVPIVPLVETLDIPTVIVPLVNMDNNQHNPNENIRIGNLRQGIAVCISILSVDIENEK